MKYWVVKMGNPWQRAAHVTSTPSREEASGKLGGGARMHLGRCVQGRLQALGDRVSCRLQSCADKAGLAQSSLEARCPWPAPHSGGPTADSCASHSSSGTEEEGVRPRPRGTARLRAGRFAQCSAAHVPSLPVATPVWCACGMRAQVLCDLGTQSVPAE